MKIFLVEDDTKIVTMVQEHLTRYGFEVVAAQDFANIVEEFTTSKGDIILLDVNLPYYDGYYWCQKLREITKVPILFISARDSNMDQVMALEYGGDDYLVKPFSYDLLLAKIRSHARRVYGDYAANTEGRALTVRELTFLPERLLVSYRDSQEQLTFREGELLNLLMTGYPEIVGRELILNKLWDDEQFVDDNTLSVNVGRLRKKLTDLGIENPIQTIRGRGYQLVVEADK